MSIAKRLLGHLFFFLRTDDPAARSLELRNEVLRQENSRYRETVVPSLKRQVELERSEVAILKVKIREWREELLFDDARLAVRGKP